MDDESVRTIEAAGRVKWFDRTRGFGFVVVDPPVPGIDTDVLLHVSCLQKIGFSFVDENAAIRCAVGMGERGWHVTDILEVDTPRVVLARLNGTPVSTETVIVKWFDERRGFGFVQRPGSAEDIFIHAVVLQEGGFSGVAPGDQIDAVIGDGKKGEHVVEAKPPGPGNAA